MVNRLQVVITHYGCSDSATGTMGALTELTIGLFNSSGKCISEPDEPVFSEYIVIENPEKYFNVEEHKTTVDGKIILPNLTINKNIFSLIKQTLSEANNFSHNVLYDWEICVCSHYDIWKPRFPFCETMVQRATFNGISTEKLGSEPESEKYFKFERNPESKIFKPCNKQSSSSSSSD